MTNEDRIQRAAFALGLHVGNNVNVMNVDWLDCLVEVMLATRCSQQVSRRVFMDLKRLYPTWTDFLHAKEIELLPVVRPVGYGRSKLRSIKFAVRCAMSDGEDYYRNAEDPVALMCTRLPGVGQKIARCVALYAWHYAYVPLDTHGYRVSTRLLGLQNGTYMRSFIEGALHKISSNSNLFYCYHMGMIQVGRTLCKVSEKHCDQCPLQPYCHTGQKEIQDADEA